MKHIRIFGVLLLVSLLCLLPRALACDDLEAALLAERETLRAAQQELRRISSQSAARQTRDKAQMAVDSA